MSFTEKGMGGLQSAIGTGLKAAAVVATAAIGGLAAGIVSSVSAAASMEQGIADIGAMMTLTTAETAQLQDHIMALGLNPNLKVSATEAAGAVQSLGTAGLTMAEIMGGASEATILLANATGLKGGSGFADAANIATDVMAQFNIKAEDLDAAVSQIAGTTIASKFTIDDYRLALGQAGGVAGAVGVEFDDFNAVIAATSSSFDKGSDAGTSFKTFLQRLVPSTEPAKEAMGELGLLTAAGGSAFFDAAGKMKSMSEIAGLLEGAFAGLSEQQKIDTAVTIFGTDAWRTAFALAKGGSKTIDEMKKIIGNVDAEELARKRMDTLSGSWEIFQGVVETLQLGLSQKFIPIVRKTVDWLTSLAQTYGPMVIDMFGVFADRIAAFIPLLGTQNLLYEDGSGLLMELTKVFGVSEEAAQDFWMEVWDVKQTIDNFIQSVKDTFRPVAEAIGWLVSWQDILTAVGVVVASIVIPAIGAFIAATAPALVVFGVLVAASALLRKGWEEDWLGIRSTTEYVWSVLSGVFNAVVIKVQWIVDTFKSQWAVLSDTNASLGDKLALVWNTIKEVAHAAWQGIVTAVSILLPPFVAKLQEWAAAAWQWITDTAWPMAKQKIAEWGAMLWRWVQDNAPQWAQRFIEWGQAAWQWITDIAIPMAMQKVREFGTSLWTWVQDNAGSWGAKLKEWGDLAWQEFAQRFPETATALTNAFQTAKTNVTTALDYVGSRFGPLGTTIQTFGVGALREIGLWVTGSETDFANVNKIVDEAKAAFGLMWDDFATRFPETAEVVNNAWTNVSNATKTAWEYVTEKASGLVTAITDFGLDSLGEIIKWATGTETEFAATQKIWEEFGLMTGEVGDDIMDALAPVGVWLETTLPTASAASVYAMEQLGQAWRDLTGQTEESLKKTEGTTGVFMEALKQILDTGLAIAITRIGTFAANLGQAFVAMKAGATGDWEGMFDALEQIQVNSHAQVLREAELMSSAVETVMERAGEDTVEGFNRGVRKALPRTTTTMHEFANAVGGSGATFPQEIEVSSPSRLFERFGAWTVEGFNNGVIHNIPAAVTAMSGLASAVTGAMSNVASNVASAMQSTMQSVVEGVRYGAGMVNLATADVVAQSLAAEQQARAAWERLRAQQAAAPPPITMPPVVDLNLDTNAPPPPPNVPTIILPPVITDTMNPNDPNSKWYNPLTFNENFLMGALQTIFPSQDISEEFANVSSFSRSLSMTLDNAILSGNLTDSQLTGQEQFARQVTGTPQDYAIEKILDSIQLLITTILTRGIGYEMNFDINDVRGDNPDNRQELRDLVAYFNALNA